MVTAGERNNQTRRLLTFLRRLLCINVIKKVNRKVQRVPQLQTAANPRHQEEEKNDKN